MRINEGENGKRRRRWRIRSRKRKKGRREENMDLRVAVDVHLRSDGVKDGRRNISAIELI